MLKSVLLGIALFTTHNAIAYEGKCGEAAKSAVKSILNKNNSRSSVGKEKVLRAKLYQKGVINSIYIVDTEWKDAEETRTAEWKLVICPEDCQIQSIESMGFKH